MTFLNPTLLFGLLAASIPLVLHLINLRKLKKVEFSTLVFLKELQKTKIRQIKLKQLLLLIIRIAIIVLLVMAFARPTIKNFSVGTSSAAKTTAVIIIDNTFSMSAVSDKGSLFNYARLTAKNLLNYFQDGDEIKLIPVSEKSGSESKPVANFSVITNSLNQLQISPVSRTLNEAFINAARILSASKNFNKEIYLLTDLQKGSIFNSQKEISDLSGSMDQNTRVYLVGISGKEGINLGIDDVQPVNQIFEKGRNITVSAKVKNYSSIDARNSIVSLYINGKRSAQQSVGIKSGESKELLFESTIADTGLIQISVKLEDDYILQDNERSFTVFVNDRPSLLLLTDAKEDSKYIKLALLDPSLKNIRFTESSLLSVSSLNLADYDAVFVVGSESSSDWNSLSTYLQKGGKAVVMPGAASTPINFQKMISALGVQASSIQFEKNNPGDIPFGFDKINSQDPLFKDLFENKKTEQIESPQIYKYFRIPSIPNGKTVIPMRDNSPFLGDYRVASGTVYLLNSAPVPAWSDIVMKGLFAPLINKLFLSCTSKSKPQNTIYAGDEIAADISNHTIKQIVIEKPGSEKEYLNSDSLINRNFLSYDLTDQFGTYKFYSNGRLLDYYTVNHNPKESVLEKFSSSDFETYLKETGFNGKLFYSKPEDDLSKIIYQSRFGTELWKYFIIFALILAVSESLLSRSSKKDMAGIESRNS